MNKMVEDLKLINPSTSEKSLEECVEYLESTFPNAVDNYLNDEENNYGLLFHIAGYNGKRQQELQEEIFDMFGVEVF